MGLFYLEQSVAEEKYWWDDKTIQVPTGLLIKGVSGEACAVYAKMKGFGAEVRCSLGGLATRLGWSTQKTRKYQAELWAAGWIWLLLEGHGGFESKAEPRHWYMAPNADEVPPQELVVRVCKNGTLPFQKEGSRFQKGLIKEAPLKTVPEANKEVIETNNENPLTSADAESKAAIAADLKAKTKAVRDYWHAAFKKKFGRAAAWIPSKKTAENEALLYKQLGTEELCRRADNCMEDGYITRPTYIYFLGHSEDFATLRLKRVQGPRNEYDRKPRGREEVPESVATLARQLGGFIK